MFTWALYVHAGLEQFTIKMCELIYWDGLPQFYFELGDDKNCK